MRFLDPKFDVEQTSSCADHVQVLIEIDEVSDSFDMHFDPIVGSDDQAWVDVVGEYFYIATIGCQEEEWLI
jgi:hypothetical protein